MNETHQTKGIIIGRRDYFEADKILTVFTEDFGKISIKARGVKKIMAKLAGHLELFNYVQLELVQGKNFFIVTGAVQLADFSELKNDFSRISLLYYWAELINELSREHIKQPEIMHCFVAFLEMLKRNMMPLAVLSALFEAQLTALSGHKPVMDACVACHNGLHPESIWFSFGKGGMLCAHCQKDDPFADSVSLNATKIMRLLFANDIVTLSQVQLPDYLVAEIQKLMGKNIEAITGREIKSKKLLVFA